MPALRVPTAILEAKGSFITHKDRQRPDEPVTDKPIGGPSPYLTPEEKKVWRDIVKRACPGVLFESDRDGVELLTRLTTKMRYRYDTMTGTDKAQIISLWGRYAMTPADRSRVVVEKAKKTSLGDFMARRTKQAPPKPELAPPPNLELVQ